MKRAIKWLTVPISWVWRLSPIDKFTAILCVIAVLQLYEFAQTERAFLIVEDVRFPNGEPAIENGTLNLRITIKNIGKHVAIVTNGISVNGGFFIVQKTLPELPPYRNSSNVVVPPLPPEKEIIANAIMPIPQNPSISDEERISGLKNGTIPFRVFGFLEYETGYLLFTGKTGFCFEYISQASRPSPATFKTCNNQNYTYVR